MPRKGLFRELYARWLKRRFYNRLFLLSAAIFIVVVYSFCTFAAVLVANLEMSSHLQRNREALTAVCDEYDRKHNNFYNIILPLYTSMENYNALSALLEGSGDAGQANDAFFKQRIVKAMQWLTVQDKDILAVLLHRKSDGADFVYYERGRSFAPASSGFPFFDALKAKPPGRSIFGVRELTVANQPQYAYGIAGTVGSRNIYNDAGSIMVAYDVIGLMRSFQQYAAALSGRYLIVSRDGEVIFDSAKELYGKPFDGMELVGMNGKTAVYSGVKVIVQTVDRSNRSFYGISIESDASVSSRISQSRLMIYGIGTGISFLSALLYLIAGILSTRRVTELERAMEHVGSNNLNYRLPVRGRGDEFEHIAIGFNQMCGELQDNINKLYVHQIRQKTAELNALQSGINPHFLYNTLEAIRSKAHEDGNDEVAEFIVLMASLLRNLVRSQMFISLRQEMDFSRMYLSMFTLRYTDRLEYEARVDPDALEYGVPKGILQPVLENYFVHGIREDSADNFLRIDGRVQDGFILFTVEDNGKGIEPERLADLQSRLDSLDTSHTTYGIANVHERIKLVFGEESGLSLESSESGTCVHVKIRAMTCRELEQSIQTIRQKD